MVNNGRQGQGEKTKNNSIQSKLAGLFYCFNESEERGNQVEFRWRMIL